MTTPEGRFLRDLLLILGGRRTPRPIPSPGQVDWAELRARVKEHRLGPLFHRELPAGLPLPDTVRAEWAEEYERQLGRAILYGDCLRNLLDAFSRQSIDSVTLKGMHLAETYYPHPALRPVDDLDLLIRPRDAKRARKILVGAGGEIREETVTAAKYLFPATGVFLELHTGLRAPERRDPAFAIRIEDFWRESVPARIAGGGTRVLPPTLNLLYLAAHLSHHAFSRLIWFYDLFLVIGKTGGEIDWERLAARAGEYRCAGQVYYPLLLTGILFGAAVPEPARARLAPRPAKRLITRSLVNTRSVLAGRIAGSGLKARLLRLLLNDSWPLALRQFFHSPLEGNGPGPEAYPADEDLPA